METGIKKYTVTFQPDNIEVQATEGKSVLESAVDHGISINSACAGGGVCGKCRVLVKSGVVDTRPGALLSQRDIDQGVALACHTIIRSDMVIEIPPESRIGGTPQTAANADALRYGVISDWIGSNSAFRHEPLGIKVHTKLDEPTLSDPISDHERLCRALRAEGRSNLQAGLGTVSRLPDMLREHGWSITSVIGNKSFGDEIIDIEPGNTSSAQYGVAVDIGTTTVVAHLVDLKSSKTLAEKARYNSQISLGEDVISRIMCAGNPGRRQQLQSAVTKDINNLIEILAAEAGIALKDIIYAVCAGNTTMIHLLLGLNPASIRKEPYVPVCVNTPVIPASDVGININPAGLLLALPCVSSYVGGDVVADVLVSGITNSEDISLLIDMGTNGELVIGNKDWLVCCSASAGPSFEGGGISCGMRASDGAIERITLCTGGSISGVSVVGNVKPLGFCGSGLIDAVAELLKNACIDRRGRFVSEECGDRLRVNDSGENEFVFFSGGETGSGRDIVLTEADISNLIHSKGSIYMAAESLIAHVDMSMTDIQHFYIAGGFGNYINIERAIEIGLLPDVDRSRFKFVGNGSVQGAKMALLSKDALDYIRTKIASSMTDFDLSSDHRYMNGYSSCLFLPHTDIERFPSFLRNNESKSELVTI